MFIKNSDQVPSVTDCDNCGVKKPSEQGYAHVAQGATGRYCEVLWFCDDCGTKQLEFGPVIDVAEAREQCNSAACGYADF